MTTVLPFVLMALVWFTVLVAIGRIVMPPPERVPLRCWRFGDVRAAASVGRRTLADALGYAHRRAAGSAEWC